MLQPKLVVILIVRRRYLQAARTKIHGHVLILNDGHTAAYQGHNRTLAVQVRIALILRVNTDRRIRHNRFRARSRNRQPLIRALYLIANMVQLTLLLPVNHLIIRQRRAPHRIPVTHAVSAVDLALLMQVHKHINYRLVIVRVHRKGRTIPVTASPQLPKLLQNDPPVLLLPLKSVFQELLPANIALIDTLLGEHLHHLGLRSYTGVVRTRHPHRFLAFHPGLAHQHILNRVVQHMPHVQYPRYVWRRDDDDVRLLVRIRGGMKELLVQPVLVPLVLNLTRVVLRR